jgi:uncharacterized membrane protein YtjA (UPF0391 family)
MTQCSIAGKLLLRPPRVEGKRLISLKPLPGMRLGYLEVPPHPCGPRRKTSMLYYSIVFLVIALIAAALGFGGIAGTATGIAKLLFLVFLVLFVVSLLLGRRPPAT